MNKNIIIALFVVLTFNACNDFLTLEPPTRINELNFYETENDFEAAMFGTYSGLQGLYSTTLLRLAELPTDNAWILWTSPSISEIEAEEIDFTSANVFVASVWDNAYQTIARSNNIINQLEASDIDASVKDQYRGEAKFLRALNYFYLVQFFGDIPLITNTFRSPDQVNTYDWTRNPAAEIYDLIVSDLQEAANLLQGTDLSKARASTGAAKALLGKVYLTRGNYDLAAATLKEVIDMNEYELQDDYHTLFTNNNDELPESIFEVKYLSGMMGEGNDFTSTFAPENFDMAIFPNNRQGSGRIVVTPNLAASYEEGDLRRVATIRDSLLLQDGSYDQVKYGIKFIDFETLAGDDGGINFTVLRYADVLLMYAEALNELGDTEEAHDYLNIVRERAGLDPLQGLSQAEFVLVMEDERRVEFAQEAHRWFDLVRTGRLQTVMNNYFQGNGWEFSVEEYEVLLPIPQIEIEITPALTQNEGY